MTPDIGAQHGDSEAGALQALGLDGAAAAAYLHLVGLTDADAAELATASGLTATEAATAAGHLVARGLAVPVSTVGDDAPRIRATPPTLALGPLLVEQRNHLTAAEGLVTRLSATYRGALAGTEGAPIEVVHGRDAVAQRFNQIQLATRHTIEAFVPLQRGPGEATVPVEDNPAEQELIRRGVRFVVVLERAWLDRPDGGSLVGDALAAGQELHIVETLPLQMVISDRRIAMVSLAGDPAAEVPGDPSAALIHEPGLVEAFRALLVAYQHRGWALTDGAQRQADPTTTGPDDIDRAILGLLNVGLTDVNIARQIGIAPRSVQRRLQRLMKLADAHSRFQLGGHAVRRGWLPEPGDL